MSFQSGGGLNTDGDKAFDQIRQNQAVRQALRSTYTRTSTSTSTSTSTYTSTRTSTTVPVHAPASVPAHTPGPGPVPVLQYQYQHQAKHSSPIITSSVGSLLHLIGSVCGVWLVGLFMGLSLVAGDLVILPPLLNAAMLHAQCCFLGRAWKFQYCNVSSSQIVFASIKKNWKYYL